MQLSCRTVDPVIFVVANVVNLLIVAIMLSRPSGETILAAVRDSKVQA